MIFHSVGNGIIIPTDSFYFRGKECARIHGWTVPYCAFVTRIYGTNVGVS